MTENLEIMIDVIKEQELDVKEQLQLYVDRAPEGTEYVSRSGGIYARYPKRPNFQFMMVYHKGKWTGGKRHKTDLEKEFVKLQEIIDYLHQ